MNSKEIAFNDLPNEILTMIFECCDIKDIPAVRCVCNRWSNIINRSLNIRKRLKLVLKDDTLSLEHPLVSTVLNTDWCFPRNIAFIDVDFGKGDNPSSVYNSFNYVVFSFCCLGNGPDLLPFLTGIGAEVETLELSLMWYRSKPIAVPNWFFLLENCPNLKTLSIRSYAFFIIDGVELTNRFNKLNLKKLEHFSLKLGNVIILQALLNSVEPTVQHLKSFTIDHHTAEDVRSDRQIQNLVESTMKLIRVNVKTLKSLTVYSFREMELLEMNKIKSLQLHEFNIYNYSKQYEPLRTFLTQQTDLQELGLYNFEDIGILADFPEMANLTKLTLNLKNTQGDIILNMEILNNFPRLEYLEMIANGYVLFTANLRQNVHLQTFKLHHHAIISSGEFVVHELIADAFPNLSNMELFVYTIEEILYISENTNIRVLTLFTREDNNPLMEPVQVEAEKFNETLNFELLDALTIYDYGNWIINNIILQHFRLPNVIELSLTGHKTYPSEITDEDLCILIGFAPALCKIHLENMCAITNATIHYMAKYAKNLKYLTGVALPQVTVDFEEVFLEYNRHINEIN